MNKEVIEFMPSPTQKEPWQVRAQKFLWTFLTIAAAILFYYIIQYLGTISEFFGSVLGALSPIIWGLIIAYLLDPVACFYERKLSEILHFRKIGKAGSCRTAAALLTLLTALAFLTALGFLVIPEISNSVTGIIKELPSQMDSLTHQLENRTFFDSNTVYGNYANNAIISALQSVENWLMSDIPSQANLIFGYFYSSVRSIFSVVYNLVIGLILSVYILIDKERLLRQVKKMTYSILPTATAVRVRRMLGRGNRKLSGAIRGKMLDSMIIGMLCFTLLMLLNLLPWFDFPYPVLLAVIVGITNVVPFFGPFVGGFITAVLVMFDSPSKVIPYVILIVALQQFDCNYLDPHIVGGSIGLRPFWSIFACLLGSGLFGVPGFVIGPPAVAFISEIVSEWMDDRLRAKHLEEEFDIPPEEEFEDFAEKDEAFTGTLLQEETSGDETTEEHHEHLLTTGKEKIRQTLQKHKKS